MPTPPHQPAVRFALNGRPIALTGRDTLLPLSSFLRERLGLTGTKVVCAEGDCGACTALLGRPVDDGQGTPRLDYRPVDTCILFAFQCHGTHVVTVEGLIGPTPDTQPNAQSHDAPDPTPLTVIQSALAQGHGSQCGFCTPGIVMALHALRERGQELKEDQLRSALSGNLCRCTGYQQIFDACSSLDPEAIARLADTYDEPALLRTLKTTRQSTVTLQAQVPTSLSVSDDGQDKSADPTSPTPNGHSPDHVTTNGQPHNPTPQHPWLHADQLPSRTVTLHLPTNLKDALAVKRDHPDALIIAGATDVGVWHNHGSPWPDHVLGLTALPELSRCTETDDTLTLGASATWDTISAFVAPHFPGFVDILDRFGSPQIRQLGTVAGNLANGSPIADSPPLLLVMEAVVEAASADRGARAIPATSFYTGYKQNVLEPDELITAVHLPKLGPTDRLHLEKTSKRRDMDISTFTAAIRLTLNHTGDKIDNAAVALGGVGPTVARLPQTEARLAGQPFTEVTMRTAGLAARKEIAPISDVRGSADFRLQLAENVFVKAFHQFNLEPVLT